MTETEGAWRRADRAEIVTLSTYFAVLVLVTDILNVRLGVEAMTVAVALPALLITRDFPGFVRDWWFLLVGLVLWHLSGPIAAESPFPAHLDFMLRADRFMFFGHDPVVLVQHALANPGTTSPLDVLAFVTYNLHVPEPYIAGYLLWRLNREVYLQFAAASLALLVLGFVIFVVFPAVPPWMASTRFGKLSHVYNGFGAFLRHHPLPFHGTPLFYYFRFRGDAVAAFPSEHAAFPMLEYLAFRRASRFGALLLLWTIWVLFVIVYLGEHWVTDALAGWLLAVALFYGIGRLIRAGAPSGA